MTVYIVKDGEAAQAQAVSLDGSGLCLKDGEGSLYIGYRAPVYDADGNVIPREELRRRLAAENIEALRERIAQMEIMLTKE